MENLLQELEKTVQDFNNINQIKGFNAKYSIWDRTSTKVLCLVIVTRLSDKVTREKYILLDTKLDIRDEITYFIDDLVMLYSRIGSVKYTPLSCNGSIGDKELEYQRFFYNVFI